MERAIYFRESFGRNDRVNMGSKTKMYHMNVLKKYIAREPEVDVLHTSTKAVAGVIYQDTGPELGGGGGSTRIRGLSSERRGSRCQIR